MTERRLQFRLPSADSPGPSSSIPSFNTTTRRAMFDDVKGYVDKSRSPERMIERIRAEHHLDRVYRFDLGENADGFSPRIQEYLGQLRAEGRIDAQVSEWFNLYPDVNQTGLKRKLAERFGIPPQWILLGAGADSILDLIARVFLDHRDAYLMPIPSFFLFEAFSGRMGAIPFLLPLNEEDGFRWTERTTRQFKERVDQARPKLIWIANPNNPTGQLIPEGVLEELTEFASAHHAFIVIDEAYGEYTDPPGGVASAARLLHRHPNLMVLRTFSKQFGLAGLRLGYLMCSAKDIHAGLQVHNPNFAVTRVAADLARLALEDEGFLLRSGAATRRNTRQVFAALDPLQAFRAIPTRTCIFMLKHRGLTGPELQREFERKGIIASAVDISGIEGKGYLRFTVRDRADNEYLIRACQEINGRDANAWSAPAAGTQNL
jgi:histidinol-phosphate aminotransferase